MWVQSGQGRYIPSLIQVHRKDGIVAWRPSTLCHEMGVIGMIGYAAIEFEQIAVEHIRGIHLCQIIEDYICSKWVNVESTSSHI